MVDNSKLMKSRQWSVDVADSSNNPSSKTRRTGQFNYNMTTNTTLSDISSNYKIDNSPILQSTTTISSGLPNQISVSSCQAKLESSESNKSNPIYIPHSRQSAVAINTNDSSTGHIKKYLEPKTGSVSGMNFLDITDAMIGPRRHSDTMISSTSPQVGDISKCCAHKFTFYPNSTTTVPCANVVNVSSGCTAPGAGGVLVANPNTIKEKIKTGLETIGVDFMRVNGAVSGFRQLKRAEEFKPTKNQHPQQSQQFSEPKQHQMPSSKRQLIKSFSSASGHHQQQHIQGKDLQDNANKMMMMIRGVSTGGGGGNQDNSVNQGSLGGVQSCSSSTTGMQPTVAIAIDNDTPGKKSSVGHIEIAGDDECGRLSGEFHSESDALCRRRDAYNNKTNDTSSRNIGYRLGKRKELFERRKRLTDYALLFSIFGIFIMILDMELMMNAIYNQNSPYSIALKILMMISTTILICLIMGFHVMEIKIFSWDDAIEDWRIAVTWQRVVQMSVEVLVCVIQPLPYNFEFKWAMKPTHIKMVSFNTVLSLPMFLRLYLILRVILLHSRLFSDAGSRSIGAMNKVSFNIGFVLKKVMTTNPGTVLLVFIMFIWFIFSWMMRICENIYDKKHGNMLNTMWLISVTFLSIGYGDTVPHTYCGRGIAIATGVTGSACTALVVAVFARRLELSRAEKHVIHFMFENQLTKQLKHYAANVLRETWLIYKYTKLVKRINPMQVRVHQRKFLRAIHGMRKVKSNQRKLQDNSNTLVDLAKTQSSIYETVTDMRIEQNYLHHRLEMLEKSLLKLQESIENLPKAVRPPGSRIHSNLTTNSTSNTSDKVQPLTIKKDN